MKIDFNEALILSVFCGSIVFFVLIFISIFLSLMFKFLGSKRVENNQRNPISDKKTYVKFEDIKDEDMLVAAFAASIDAVCDDDNKTVKILSIREL